MTSYGGLFSRENCLFYIFLILMLLWICFRMPFHHKPLDNNLWRNFPLLLHTKQSRYVRIEEYLWVRSMWCESMNDSLQAALTEAQMHCGHFGKTNRCEKPNSWRKAHNTSKSELAEQSAWLIQSDWELFSMETSLHPFTVVRIHKSQRASHVHVIGIALFDTLLCSAGICQYSDVLTVA